MKYIPIIAMLLCGCSQQSDNQAAQPSPIKNSVSVKNYATDGVTYVEIVEVGGHRFAIAQGYHECAICEVTDASLVKVKAEDSK